MRMKRLLTILIMVLALIKANGQIAANDSWQHEYEGEIPIYIDSIQAQLTYPLAFRNYQDAATWRETAREKVFECMGPPPPLPEKWDMEVLAEEQRDGYIAQCIAFNLSRWYRVKAYLLIPTRYKNSRPSPLAPRPAIVLLHDHGAHLSIGKEKMIRPFAVDSTVINDADAWVENLYEGQYLGDYLAKNGYVVFSIDAPLWGERGRKEGADRKKYDIIAGNMMMLGGDLCAYMHYDDLRSVDFLASLPFVDTSRIGAAGCSMGAYRTWMLAALSDKIAVGCADCWMVTTKAQLTTRYGRKENGGFANCIPGLRRWMDYPDIASLAAPKPMLFINGKRDKLFPVAGVEKAYEIMHDVWDAFGISANLETYLLEQGHECNKENQGMILDFFNHNL